MPETLCHDDIEAIAPLLLAMVVVHDGELVGPIIAGADSERDVA